MVGQTIERTEERRDGPQNKPVIDQALGGRGGGGDGGGRRSTPDRRKRKAEGQYAVYISAEIRRVVGADRKKSPAIKIPLTE